MAQSSYISLRRNQRMAMSSCLVLPMRHAAGCVRAQVFWRRACKFAAGRAVLLALLARQQGVNSTAHSCTRVLVAAALDMRRNGAAAALARVTAWRSNAQSKRIGVARNLTATLCATLHRKTCSISDSRAIASAHAVRNRLAPNFTRWRASVTSAQQQLVVFCTHSSHRAQVYGLVIGVTVERRREAPSWTRMTCLPFIRRHRPRPAILSRDSVDA